jgi:hypothetical protein
MRLRLEIILLTIPVTACAGACDGASGGAGIAGLPSDTIQAEPLAVIGELDGPAEYLLGDVASVAVGPGNIIYVADRLGATVRAYDLQGQFLSTIGTEGDGPGEFRFPNDLTFDPGGQLYVRERYRVTVFGPSGGFRELRDSVIRTFPLDRPALESARASTNGRHYYSPSYYYYAFVTHRYFYEVLDLVGSTGDTIPVPAFPNPEILGRANYPIQGGQLGMPVNGVNMAPFEPRPTWALTNEGRVLMTFGDDYEVWRLNEVGDTVHVIQVQTAPAAVPPGELGDSTRAFHQRLDSIPVPLSEVRGMSDRARNRQVPEILPKITGLFTSDSGNIWLRRWPSGGHTSFDVFNASGEPLHTVRVPAVLSTTPPPYVSERLLVGVTRSAVTGVQQVAAFSVSGG